MTITATQLYINMTNSSRIDISEGAQTPGATGNEVCDSVEFTYEVDNLEVSGFLSLHANERLSYSMAYNIGEDVAFDIECEENAISLHVDANPDFIVDYKTKAGNLYEVKFYDAAEPSKCIYHLKVDPEKPVLVLC